MKTETKKKLYEAMFLVDSADAGSDWDGIVATITKILERGKVDIVSIRKWDDRRLAYEIKGKSRGTYMLCYFRSDGQLNQEIEKAVQLSERIMRVLILCVDWMTDEDIEKDTPAMKAEKEKEDRETAEEEDDYDDEDDDEDEDEDEDDDTDEDKFEDKFEPAEAVAAAVETPLKEEPVEAESTDASEEAETDATEEPIEQETEDFQDSQPKITGDE